MAEDRRRDITLEALRHNWVIIVAAFFAILAYANGENRIAKLESAVEEHDQLLDREAFKRFAVWQTNVDRDLEQLKEDVEGIKSATHYYTR